MIRGKREGKSFATWFIGFDHEVDNGLIPPPLLTNGNFAPPTSQLDTPTSTTPTTPADNNNKDKDKREIYREAFESTKRTEEAKFKLRFNNLLSDMQQACEKLSPRGNGMPSKYGSASYGEMMANYRARIKDMLVSLSQRLELAVESFDDSSPHSASSTSQKVKVMVSKLLEDRLGESLELTSDEAVSDLSSLSDESGELKSFEDQLAQAVVARMLELHRKESGDQVQLEDEAEPMDQQTDSSASEEKLADRTMSSSTSDEKHVMDSVQSERKEKHDVNVNHECQGQGHGEEEEELGEDQADGELSRGDNPDQEPEEDLSEKEDDVQIVKREFEKLKLFAAEVQPRPLYEEINVEEEVEEEPIEESFDETVVDHAESQNDFTTRFYTYDRVNDPEHRTDFSALDYEYHDFGIDEVDPDLLSMNMGLGDITEETEEELEEDKDNETRYERDWRGNWIFQGGAGLMPYNTMEMKKTTSMDLGDIYKGIPHEGEEYVPKIGNKDADQTSDMSENEERDSEGLSDEEDSFYSKTSEEIARISRKSTSRQASTSAQTDESDVESVSRQMSTSTDSGRKEQESFESKTSEALRKKLSEELIPSTDNDPKFEIPPDSTSVPEGEPAKFMCRVAGSSPLEVQWYRVTEEIEQLEESEKFEISQDGNRHHITMFNLTQEDAGQYMCIVVNDKGRCCQYFILSLKKNTQDTKAPEFLKGIADVDVQEGESVKFRCKVKGYPQPRVVWYKDGQLLTKGINYRLERFGNRDYILAIDAASMDEDAEYSVVAKNIAGEARSSAQLIVEPKHKPESSPAKPKSSKWSTSSSSSSSSNPATSPHEELAITIPTWSRSRAGVSLSSRKQNQNLTNLSQKVSMTKDSVAKEAEDMLSSTKERESAENIRKVTSSALDLLNSTESALHSPSTGDYGILATSTPRTSDTESLPSHSNRNSQSSDRVPVMDYQNNLVSPSSDDDKHKSEFSFSFTPKNQNAQNDSSESLPTDTQKQTTVSDITNRPIRSSVTDNVSVRHDSQSDTSLSAQTDTDTSFDVDTFGVPSRDVSFDSEPLRINLGPKRENKERYTKDFYVTNTPVPERKHYGKQEKEEKKPLSLVFSPRAVEKEEKDRAHTEEKIYLTAASVTNLETNVMSLHDKVRAIDALAQQDRISNLEDQVARTVAKVVTAEKDVKFIEKKVHKLNEPKPRADNSASHPTVAKAKHAPAAPKAVTMAAPPQPQPERTNLKGHTRETELPESRTEFNEDYGAVELPSVNRLKAMFSNSSPGGSHDSRDASVKRVHSITARSVPKGQLEKLRRTEEVQSPLASTAKVTLSKQTDQPVTPGRATALTTGQQIKQMPAEPKQIFQSSDVHDKRVEAQVTSKQQPMKITLSSNTNRPISPVQEDLSPRQQPIRAHTPGKPPAPKEPMQAQVSTDAGKSGTDIDTPDGRKSPKIRFGAISAMSRFWEKRTLGEKPNVEEYPDILDN